VAGLLDTVWWIQNGGWKPLLGSLNPSDRVNEILTVPQIHFYGTEDNIIPPELSTVYASKGQFTNLSRVAVKTNHYKLWTNSWENLLRKFVLPMRNKASKTGIAI
jgi:hypothetical protein